MSATTIELATASRECLERSRGSLERTAFYLEGRGDPFFAWLHLPSQEVATDHGVIVCPPIGFEQIHTHRSLRHLADQLALARMPALRFDWHGTGDSPGDDADPHRLTTWLSNLREASEWMRQLLGCRRISVIGLRLGATLAALASTENRIDDLVLWSPVVKGRNYVREMKAVSLTSDAPVRPSSVSSIDIEAGGFTLSSETAASLNAIDLMKRPPTSCGVLIVGRADVPDDKRLESHWASLGVPVEHLDVTGFHEMMAEPHRNQVPDTAIRQITDWLNGAGVRKKTRHASRCAAFDIDFDGLPSVDRRG